MPNRSMPVASRTRGRLDALLYKEYKKRKEEACSSLSMRKRKEEEDENMAKGEGSSSSCRESLSEKEYKKKKEDDFSCFSEKKRKEEEEEENMAKGVGCSSSRDTANGKESGEVQILIEDSDSEEEEYCKKDEEAGLCLVISDDDDDDDVDDFVPMDGYDGPASCDDNDDSDDLDYYGKEEEEESDEETVGFETASHVKRRGGDVVCISDKNGRENCQIYNSEGIAVGLKRRKPLLVGTDDSDVDEDVTREPLLVDTDDSDVDEDVTRATSSRRKGKPRSSKKFDLLKILTESILGEEEEDSGSTMEEPFKQETVSNPLKFTFRLKETIPPEKTESEEEMDALWAEYQFCLASSEISSADAPMVENEGDDVSEVKHDIQTLCGQGNHNLILDEELGLKCKYCSYLHLEIKYIVPPFMKDPYGKSERRDSWMVDSAIFDGLQYQDSDSDMLGCDPYVDTQGTVWEIIPNVKGQLYPHQREGFEFIWNNIAGGIYRDKSKNSSEGVGGCIISHAPGTGKTLLTILFLYTYIKEYPGCRPVIVAPRSMLLTWEAEFRKWKVDIPFHNLNSLEFSGKEKAKGIGLYEKFKQNVPDGPLARRLVKLLSWKSDGGILGISYRLFEQLAGRRRTKCTDVEKHVSRILLDLPGLFVLDEGHTPRNDGSLMWKALSMIKTEHRIILSGTPFQNNFDELFNTLQLVRPKFAEGIQSRNQERVGKKHSFKRNEAKQKWASLTGSIGKVDRYDAEKVNELRAVIKPFVHVHKGTILQTTLPGLRHSMVFLQPSGLQKKILEHLKETKNALFLDYYVSLVSIHPSLLHQLSDDKDHKDVKESVGSFVRMDELERIRLKPDEGVKTKFLKELLRLSEALNEKVIVFGQYLEPLNLIMDQLKEFFKWKEGQEILYMHGKCDIKQRQSSINAFNDPTSQARVLLASTKACSEGINLVGGSRVVLLDVAWNPSVERQAISRAYRLGQERVVYTYHLISSGTMEELKCSRQAGKDRLSELVFHSPDNGDDCQKKVYDVLDDKILEEMFQHERLKCMFKKIQPKDLDLIVNFGD